VGPRAGSDVMTAGVSDLEDPNERTRPCRDARNTAGGRTGAGCEMDGEQQRQQSSGKPALCKLTVEAACEPITAIAPGPDEFIGAAGSQRSKAQ
jgi:hypothetical protein